MLEMALMYASQAGPWVLLGLGVIGLWLLMVRMTAQAARAK